MVGDRIEKYLFITTGSFPVGDAASNRALSYLRGLVELNCDVTLLVLGPDYNQSKLSNRKKTNYKGIKIKYTSPSLFVKRGIIGKLNFLIGIFFGFIYLLRNLIKFKGKLAVALLFIEPILLHLFILPIKIFKSCVFHERTEFPFINRKNNFFYKYYLNTIIQLFDGVYVISFPLLDFFKKITIKPILHLPMTVEIDRFQIEPEPTERKYIAYCGSMYTDKDGVPDLIDAFNLIVVEYDDLYLYLIGDNSDKTKFKLIQEKINASPFSDRIICTGQVSRDEMPKLLKNAVLLALCRPNNIQAQGGVPTKLGEYLATSNPVVLTDVGDHSKYLQDRISAFIAKSNSPIHFSVKLKECMNNPELAKEVGVTGYYVAYEHFNYKNQAIKLKEFIENIK